MPITHSKVSPKSDGGDSTLVLPSDWNDEHTLPTHNETSSKQGGTTSEYYHLTAAQHAAVVAGGFTDSITLGGNSNTISFLKITHQAGANIKVLQFVEYNVGYASYPDNVTVQICETGVNYDRLMLKATDDMSGFMFATRFAADGVGAPHVTISHASSSTDCPIMNFNMFGGQANPCIQFSDSNYVMPPMSAPPYTQVVSGAKGSRTYYLKYTYVSATGETTPCALVGGISMDANKLLRLTIPPAPDPRITHAKIYIHTSSSPLYLQDTVAISAYSTTTWTETTGALNTSGTTVPSTNTTGGVMFTMSSVYHGIGFYMKGVGSQAYNYVQINNSSDTPLFRITNSDAIYFRSNTFHVYNASGSTVFYTTSTLAIAYVTFQANAGINLVNAGDNTINATQGSINMTAQTDIVIDATGAANTVILKSGSQSNLTVAKTGIQIYTPDYSSATLDLEGNHIECSSSLYISAVNSGSIELQTGSTRRIYIKSDGNIALGNYTSPSCKCHVMDDRIRINDTLSVPTASSPGNTGDIGCDTQFIYVCVATNTWKRVPIATW